MVGEIGEQCRDVRNLELGTKDENEDTYMWDGKDLLGHLVD